MASSLSHELIPGERPPFTLCEPVVASSRSLWCIRKTTDVGPKFGGGVDTPSLCGRVRVGQGWDLQVRITEHHLDKNTCKACLAKYRDLMRLPALYGRVYHVLVELAGADPAAEADFVRYFAEATEDQPPREWRFQGKFGSGGKLHKVPHGHEVTCYPEDLDRGGRGELLRVVNEALALLGPEFKPTLNPSAP